MNRIEARAPGFGFPKLKEGPSEALPAIGGIDSDVVNKKSFIVNGEDYYPPRWFRGLRRRLLAD